MKRKRRRQLLDHKLEQGNFPPPGMQMKWISQPFNPFSFFRPKYHYVDGVDCILWPLTRSQSCLGPIHKNATKVAKIEATKRWLPTFFQDKKVLTRLSNNHHYLLYLNLYNPFAYRPAQTLLKSHMLFTIFPRTFLFIIFIFLLASDLEWRVGWLPSSGIRCIGLLLTAVSILVVDLALIRGISRWPAFRFH